MSNNLLEIDLGTNFIPMQIMAGEYHTCALSTAYKVKCWGYNLHGSLGYGDTNDRGHEPKQMGDILLEIDLGTNFIPMQIMAGDCFIPMQIVTGYDHLLEIDLGTNFIPMQIMAGDYHTCALSTANKVKCWGYNFYGQLGYGDTNNRGNETNEMSDNLLGIDLGTNF
eukprot:336333_1